MKKIDPCPFCEEDGLLRDEADVGVGTIYGPASCSFCGAYEKTDDHTSGWASPRKELLPDALFDQMCQELLSMRRLMSTLKVWVVKFSNYEPAEIHSIHRTREGAEAQAFSLGDGWEVGRWEVDGKSIHDARPWRDLDARRRLEQTSDAPPEED